MITKTQDATLGNAEPPAGLPALTLGDHVPFQPVTGEAINLDKAAANAGVETNELSVNVDWCVVEDTSTPLELEPTALCLLANGRTPSREHLISPFNPTSPKGFITLLQTMSRGMASKGDTADDSEVMRVHLKQVPLEIVRILFVLSIHDAFDRRQDFSRLSDITMRLVDTATRAELIRYTQSYTDTTATTMTIGELYRNPDTGLDEWAFRGLSQTHETIGNLVHSHGIDL